MHYPWPLRRLLLLARMKGAEAGYSYQHYASHAHTSHTPAYPGTQMSSGLPSRNQSR